MALENRQYQACDKECIRYHDCGLFKQYSGAGILFGLVLLLSTCATTDEDGGGSSCFDFSDTGTFSMVSTNSSNSFEFLAEYRFSCYDDFGGSCKEAVFDDCPDREDSFFRYSVAGGCSDFTAMSHVTTHEGVSGRFDFFGTVLRAHGQGSGPLASGTFSFIGTDGSLVDQGTFQFFEGNIAAPSGDPDAPSLQC